MTDWGSFHGCSKVPRPMALQWPPHIHLIKHTIQTLQPFQYKPFILLLFFFLFHSKHKHSIKDNISILSIKSHLNTHVRGFSSSCTALVSTQNILAPTELAVESNFNQNSDPFFSETVSKTLFRKLGPSTTVTRTQEGFHDRRQNHRGPAVFFTNKQLPKF